MSRPSSLTALGPPLPASTSSRSPTTSPTPPVPPLSSPGPPKRRAQFDASSPDEIGVSADFECKIYSKGYTGDGMVFSTPEYLCFRPLAENVKGVNLPWKSVLLITQTSPKEFDVITKAESYTFYRVDDIGHRFTQLQKVWCFALNVGHNEGDSVNCLRGEDLDRLLAHFNVLDLSHAGMLSRADFVRPLLPLYETSTLPDAIFQAFDAARDGSITLGEWLEGMRALTVGSPADKLEFSFRVFAGGTDGELTLRQFETIVRNLASITTFSLPQDEAGYTTFCSRLFRTFPLSPRGNITLSEFSQGMPNLNLEEICGLQNFDIHVTRYGPPPKKHGVPLGFGDPQWPLVS
eukprot:RCo021113